MREPPADPAPVLPPRDRLLVVALGLLAAAIASALALGPLDGVAHVSDEVAYSLQAELFAQGLRVGPPPDQPSMLLYPFWETRGGVHAVFPPGWPALLALGAAVGLPWLINPLCAAFLPALSFLLARTWGRPLDEARLAALVMALSPGVLLLAASRMAHTSVLLALLGALLLVERRDDGDAWWLLGGAGLAYVVLARHFDALLFAGPLIALGLWRVRGRAWSWIVLPAAATFAILFDNEQLTGDALSFPVNTWYDHWVGDFDRKPGCNRLGFGPDIGCHPTLGSWGHTPAKAAAIAGQTLEQLDRHLLGLPGGVVLALLGAARSRHWRLPLALTVLAIGGYAFYWAPGQVYGARFWHPLYAVLPVLVAAAFGLLPPRLRLLVPAGIMLVTAGLGLRNTLVDWRAPYWCVDGDGARLLADHGIDRGVVLLRASGSREAAWPWLGVTSLTCDPLLESGDFFQLTNPALAIGGLQVRHAPGDDQLDEYLDTFQPGAPAWLVEHDVVTDTHRIRQLRP